jgi:PAS domain S-box-containing protein
VPLDYRALFEDNPNAMVVFDRRTRELLAVNDAACRHFGYTRGELLGRDVSSLRPPEDVQPMLQAYGESLSHTITGPMPFPGGVWRHQRKDGSIAHVELWRIRVDFEGRPASLVVIWNVSDRVKAETERTQAVEALRHSEERFRALIENSADGVGLLDAAGQIVFMTDSIKRTLGWEPAQMVGTSFHDWIHPDDLQSVEEAFRGTIAASRSSTPVTSRVKHPDGSWRWIEGIVTNLLDLPAVGAVVANFRDVTDRRQLEEQLRQSQKMEATGLLAGGIAHDFNNMLGVMLGAAELARRSAHAGRPVEAHLADIEAAAGRAADLTRKLLAFSRKQVLHVVPLDLGEAVDGFTALLRRVIGEDVEFEVQRPAERLVVDADSTQLEQVLLNLATNARQAMPSGGKLTIQLRRTFFDEALASRHAGASVGDHVELTVRDNGVGMDPQTLARASEPFFTTKPGGTGLGLAVVHGVVHQHRGLLDVESSPGEGTRVSIFFPLSTSPRGPAEEPKWQRAPQPQGGSETVLVAEDEPSLRRMLAITLGELGYSVIAAGDGQEAARAFEAAPDAVDLAILDVVMPKLGGVEAYARMRAIAPSLKVIFTTGYAPESAQVSEIVTRGRHALLSKPFSLDVFATKVREILDGRG